MFDSSVALVLTFLRPTCRETGSNVKTATLGGPRAHLKAVRG